MWKRGLLICSCGLLAAVLPPAANAQQGPPGQPVNSAVRAAGRSGAEFVYNKAASKVVYLIARKADEIHARASGIILTSDGYVATNYHALFGADSVEIRYFPNPTDTETYQSFNGAKLLYGNAEQDVAVLKVNAHALPFLECGDGTQFAVRIGEPVFAIGNPRGLNNTISEGIVSAVRSADGEAVIQHTAAISPGSSGGALLDSNAALLGMNSWQVANGQNLNFAISAAHLVQALAAARRTSAPMSFPPDEEGEADVSLESGAEVALRSKDYIQAINQAQQAVASGISNSHIYSILGSAKEEQGKAEEAEQYVRQAISLAGPDDKYKQSSRFILIRILADRFNAHPAAVDRLAFLQLINDFLNSKSPLGGDQSYEVAVRTWAASVPEHLRSLEGVWRETATTLVSPPACHVEYNFRLEGSGYFLKGGETASDDKDVKCGLWGTVEPSGDGFAGELTRVLGFGPPSWGGLAEQKLRLTFKLANDLMTIEGTATGGPITKSGPGGKSAVNLLSFPPGPNGPWHFTLRRVE
jgi:S1-C subfamily serine protease